MWKMLKTFLIIERSTKSNFYSLFIVTALIIGVMFMASKDTYNNLLVDATSEYQSTTSALSKFQIVDVSTIDNSDSTFGILTRLRQAIALKLAALKTEKENMLHIALERTINLRESLYDANEFEKVRNLIPPKIHNDNERVFVQALLERELPLKQDMMQYWPFLLSIFTMVGLVWFPFLSFYTSGIMIEDFKHLSIVKGYPIRFDKYVVAKSISKIFIIFIYIALIFILSLPLIFWKGLGYSNYPVIVYNGEPIAYTIPQYILLCFAFMFIITIFTLLLSIIFNMLFKNMYITFFVQIILYFIPIIFSSLISLIPYNPFNFLNFNMIIKGGSLELENPINLTYIGGFITLLICIVIMLFIIQRFLSASKIKRV